MSEISAKIRRMTGLLTPHLRHTSDCTINLSETNPASDYCSCHLTRHIKEANEILMEITEVLGLTT